MSFGKKLYKLRTMKKLSQEELAEVLDVSRQTITKWESGAALPETIKLMKISKFFGVSIDSLILDAQTRMREELLGHVIPSYECIPEGEFYGSDMAVEYRQSYDEGLDIEEYKNLFEAVGSLPKNSFKKELADTVEKIVLSARYREDFKYTEPSELTEIKALRQDYELKENKQDVTYDKIYGAWVGRVCGCMLGKTVEGIKIHELTSFLKATDNFPMKRYITTSDLKKIDTEKYSYGFATRAYADKIDCMPADDDTNYTVLAQRIFEKYGPDFTAEDVAAEWIRTQSKEAYWTAERVAFCNIIKGYLPPMSAIHKNPYREWIGAQIRADYWGYINPGNPERAAEMAWRDATVSHIKNGIYGEMFVAAMLATAAVTSDTEEIIRSGLAQIPATSRLFESVMHILEQYKGGADKKACFDDIYARYDDSDVYNWCHTISNAMIVAASLLYGNGEYGKSICMAVEAGFDTDCNGATVGSIVGMAHGINCIDTCWSEPIHDTVDTSIFGVGKISISDAAEKTMLHIKQMR